MLKRLSLCALTLVLAGCKTSTGPALDLTGSWQGNWVTTAPPGPPLTWTASLVQAGSAVTGTLNCAGIEPYTVAGTNLANALSLTLVGSLGDTAFFTGTASTSGGVQAMGNFSDADGAGCFTGIGTWSGKIK